MARGLLLLVGFGCCAHAWSHAVGTRGSANLWKTRWISLAESAPGQFQIRAFPRRRW